MQKELTALIEKAKQVLNGNWLGNSTKPSPHLYPHQWNWDSGFIAIGYARYDTGKAQKELQTLFNTQWKNGMLPQIVFNKSALGNYFPEPDFWLSERSEFFPKNCLSSGITMPPIHAISVLQIYKNAPDKDQTHDWLKEIFPKLLALHKYLYKYRDPNKEGLVYIRHPWESGLDNSPTWDKPFCAIDIDLSDLPPYQRKDLKKGIPKSQRPTAHDYHRYVYLVDLFRKSNYDENVIQQECPFLIQDPLFNSILAKANEDLLEIAQIINEDTKQIEEWIPQTKNRIKEKLWHESCRAFDAYDLRAKEQIGTISASGFMPLICGCPTTKQANTLYSFLESHSFCAMHQGNCFSIPNYNMGEKEFNPLNYWRGPVWINTNWLLMKGLERYGFNNKAQRVREDIIELVRRFGFFEYFDPFKGTGYGTKNFSWTAALFIDVALDEIVKR